MSMISYTKRKIAALLRIEFIRFCIVGGLGFIINFSILLLLHVVLGWPRFISQFIGAEVALFSNFMLHHHWTYKQHQVKKSLWSLIVQFHAVSWPAIIGSALMVSFFGGVLNMNDFVALVLSSTVALFWNFLWSKYVVWRDVKPGEIEKL